MNRRPVVPVPVPMPVLVLVQVFVVGVVLFELLSVVDTVPLPLLLLSATTSCWSFFTMAIMVRPALILVAIKDGAIRSIRRSLARSIAHSLTHSLARTKNRTGLHNQPARFLYTDCANIAANRGSLI